MLETIKEYINMEKKSEILLQFFSMEKILKCLNAAEEALKENPRNVYAQRLKKIAKEALNSLN